jgi:nucleoside-diphosphate-sugar epimerase
MRIVQNKILITGGAGFIGSNLASRLNSLGNDVVVLDSLLRGNKLSHNTAKEVKLIVGDVRDKGVFKQLDKDFDIIFHFAAVLGVDVVADNPVETMDTELIGLRNAVEFSQLIGLNKLIYASTSGVYGSGKINTSMYEEMFLEPKTSYSIAKRYNEIYLKALFEEKSFESVSIRFFNVYGQNQDTRMVIPRFIEQALSNQPITVFGNGMQTRDFTFIDDTIESSILLSNNIKGCQVYNVANECEHTILELAELIKELTNSKSEIILVNTSDKRYDYEVERRYGDSTKLYKAIGFKPSITLKEGLKRILKLN